MSETSNAPDPGSPSSVGQIVCPMTPWYFRRMGLMFLMVFGLGLWFLYDGLAKYPGEIAVYAEFTAIQEQNQAYGEMETAGRLAEWPELARAKGWPEGKPVDWVVYSGEKGWPEDPHKRSPGDETMQFVFAGLMLLIAIGVLVVFLVNRSKFLQADGGSFTTPGGVRIPFEHVFRVDKRKWKHKGLAYVYHRSPEGASGKAPIDDLKFDGAQAVLDRILESFEGDLIDRVDSDDEAESEAGEGDAEQAGEGGKDA